MIEKVISYVKGLVLMSVLVFIPAACSHGVADEPEPIIPTPVVPDPVVPEEPDHGNEVLESDTIVVSFIPKSLEWGVAPMSRASSDDLYAVVVYQSNSEVDGASFPLNSTQSALALFDDLNLLSLKLAKNQVYHFAMTYIPNGKNIIEKVGDGWGTPFRLTYAGNEKETPSLNTVVYKRLINTVGFVDAASQVKEGNNGQLARYMGVFRNFKPSENNKKVPIELYRFQYGIKITATDFNEGTISFMNSLNPCEVLATIQSNSTGTSTVECILECGISHSFTQVAMNYDNLGEYDFLEGFKKVVYTTPAGEEIILWSCGNGTFRRMKMHTLEFSLSNAMANGGITPDLMDSATDPMEEVRWEL